MHELLSFLRTFQGRDLAQYYTEQMLIERELAEDLSKYLVSPSAFKLVVI